MASYSDPLINEAVLVTLMTFSFLICIVVYKTILKEDYFDTFVMASEDVIIYQ